MAIHSRNEWDSVDVDASTMATAGVHTSLGATAAALLRANPRRELKPRLSHALQDLLDGIRAMRAHLASADRLLSDEGSVPEQLLASLAVRASEPDARAEVLARTLDELVESLQMLVHADEYSDEEVTSAAADVENFLGELGILQTTRSQGSFGDGYEMAALVR